eukprot:scaffold13602_cov214-Alexandrium_tamarense.AAC.4
MNSNDDDNNPDSWNSVLQAMGYHQPSQQQQQQQRGQGGGGSNDIGQPPQLQGVQQQHEQPRYQHQMHGSGIANQMYQSEGGDVGVNYEQMMQGNTQLQVPIVPPQLVLQQQQQQQQFPLHSAQQQIGQAPTNLPLEQDQIMLQLMQTNAQLFYQSSLNSSSQSTYAPQPSMNISSEQQQMMIQLHQQQQLQQQVQLQAGEQLAPQSSNYSNVMLGTSPQEQFQQINVVHQPQTQHCIPSAQTQTQQLRTFLRAQNQVQQQASNGMPSTGWNTSGSTASAEGNNCSSSVVLSSGDMPPPTQTCVATMMATVSLAQWVQSRIEAMPNAANAAEFNPEAASVALLIGRQFSTLLGYDQNTKVGSKDLLTISVRIPIWMRNMLIGLQDTLTFESVRLAVEVHVMTTSAQQVPETAQVSKKNSTNSDTNDHDGDEESGLGLGFFSSLATTAPDPDQEEKLISQQKLAVEKQRKKNKDKRALSRKKKQELWEKKNPDVGFGMFGKFVAKDQQGGQSLVEEKKPSAKCMQQSTTPQNSLKIGKVMGAQIDSELASAFAQLKQIVQSNDYSVRHTSSNAEDGSLAVRAFGHLTYNLITGGNKIDYTTQVVGAKLDVVESADVTDLDCDVGGHLDSIQIGVTSNDGQCDTSFREISLRQWIERSELDLSSYLKSVIPLAIKLVDFLIQGYSDEQNDKGKGSLQVPQASISTANVLVLQNVTPRNHYAGHAIERSTVVGGMTWEDLTEENFMALLKSDDPESITDGEGRHEVIGRVRIVSSAEGGSDLGDTMHRLTALGLVLYELFSREEPSLHKGGLQTKYSVVGISLNDECGNLDRNRPSKKSQRNASSSSDVMYTESIERLEFLGIPQSLCTLVKNLLDCHEGVFVGDEAYKSFEDIRADLQLMIDDPSRFLNNISPKSHPTFSISDELYGRDADIVNVNEAYQQHLTGNCRGILVMGEAGVGKSCLVSRVASYLIHQGNGYLLGGKWDQNHEIKPLSIVGSVFNKLCEVFVRVASPPQRVAAASELKKILGSQASLLLEIMPSLSKIIALCEASNTYFVDSAESMRFLCCKLLNILSNNLARRIVIWLDDLQWSDSASMLLIGSLLADAEVSKYVFFICSYRDEEINGDVSFNSWLTSIPEATLRRIHLTNLNENEVNTLISDALQLFPRLTRPLSSVVHHKTRGNPLFVVQLFASLKEEGYLRLRLSPCRWTWDLEQIIDLKISDNVLELLMKEMGKLSSELQLGLKVASCMGSYVKKSTLDIMSNDVGVDLREVLYEVSRKGFMDDVGDRFRFCHDRIEQAAYDLMSFEERRARHMKFGLVLCVNSLGNSSNDEVFFMALNQIGRGGPEALTDPEQRNTIAKLSLKAGRRCIVISDFASAFHIYKSGISFLNDGHWELQYELSIELFDATIDVACTLNDTDATKLYSEELLLHAKADGDKLNTLYTLLKSLRLSMKVQESKTYAYAILNQLGEELPRSIGDLTLVADIQDMKEKISNMSDNDVLGLRQTDEKKVITLMKLYNDLLISFQVSYLMFSFALELTTSCTHHSSFFLALSSLNRLLLHRLAFEWYSLP